MADRYKDALRLTNQQVRKNLSLTYQHTAARQICHRIRQLDAYRRSTRIALYRAVHGEVDLHMIWQTASLHSKYCYFPVLHAHQTLLFLPALPHVSFHQNKHGIEEPDVPLTQAIHPSELDIIFMPLVAFDLHGTRLGMGAGYYDRTLADEKRPLLVGIAYEFQRQAFIEAQPWDVPLNVILTERTTYWSLS